MQRKTKLFRIKNILEKGNKQLNVENSGVNSPELMGLNLYFYPQRIICNHETQYRGK
jgi:hypothetical protein